MYTSMYIGHCVPLPMPRRPAVTEDPSCEHHLYWPSPPETVLVVKKIRDLEVTEKFKTIVAFLMKVCNIILVTLYHYTCTCIYHLHACRL